MVEKPNTPASGDTSIPAEALQLVEIAAEDSQQLEEFQRPGTNLSDTRKEAARPSATKNSTVASQPSPAKAGTSMSKNSVARRLEELQNISINEMLAEVREIWLLLDQDEGELELDLLKVSQFLSEQQVIPDVSSASKYILTTIQAKTKQTLLNYDDFNSIFCKGIFRHAIVSKNRQMEQEVAAHLRADEVKLEFKMIHTRNAVLMKEIRNGRIETADEPA